MSDAALQHTALAAPADTRARTFLVGLLLVSVLPTVFFALAGGSSNAAIAQLGRSGVLLGTAHVALTGWFWLDRRYREHIHAHTGHYYVLPAAVAAVSIAAVYVTGPEGGAIYFAIYSLWAYHHFGRQNHGVLALAAAGTKSGPATSAERQLCRAAPVAGALGAVAQIPPIAGSEWADLVRLAGLSVALGVAAVGLGLAAQQAHRGAAPLRVAVTAMVSLFFLPIYLLPAGFGAAAVGVAHSYQYALIVGYMAASRHKAGPQRWVLPLGALTTVYLAVYLALRASFDSTAPGLLAAASTAWMSITVWHFIADADLWRLSRPFQRAALRERLPFLFRG